jgi:hypothetical protein
MSAGTVDGDGNIKIDSNPFDGIEGTFDDLWDTLDQAGEITVTSDEAEGHINETLLKAYSGDYSGTWRGTANYDKPIQTSGTWEMEIDEEGNIVGSYTGTFDGEKVEGDVTGSIDPNGDTELGTDGQAGGIVMWWGKINLANGGMAGDYSGEYERGTFTGKKITE